MVMPPDEEQESLSCLSCANSTQNIYVLATEDPAISVFIIPVDSDSLPSSNLAEYTHALFLSVTDRRVLSQPLAVPAFTKMHKGQEQLM